MIQSDAAFLIGKTHKVCQDYALANNNRGRLESIWLSDGCSSSPNTDIGARLLSHGMQQRVSAFEEIIAAGTAETQQTLLDALVRKNLRFAARSAKRMGLRDACTDATLLGLVHAPAPEGEEDSVFAVIYGDGAVVFGRTDGTREVYRSQYPAGYPFYPMYAADHSRFACWQEVAGNCHTITRTTLLPDGSVGKSDTFVPDAPFHLLRLPATDFCFAAILSDGVESFQSKVGAETCSTFKAVDYLPVVHELTAFKNFKGEFVHRRMQSFEKECGKRGWHHNDDISVAAICLENEKA